MTKGGKTYTTYQTTMVTITSCPEVCTTTVAPSQGGNSMAERRGRGGWGSVLENVPPDVPVADQGAGNLAPVDLCVLSASDSLVQRLSNDWPSGLGNPDWLAHACAFGSIKSFIERRVGNIDAVVDSGLEVRVGVHTEPIACFSDGGVAAVHPSSPGVYVANGLTRCSSAGDGIADLVDVAHELLGLSAQSRVVLG